MKTKQTDLLNWLVTWFCEQTDGLWEHQHGITIETLDNPGWHVEIDLQGTPLEGKSMKPVFGNKKHDGWINAKVENSKFIGSCDSTALTTLLNIFRQWAV